MGNYLSRWPQLRWDLRLLWQRVESLLYEWLWTHYLQSLNLATTRGFGKAQRSLVTGLRWTSRGTLYVLNSITSTEIKKFTFIKDH